MSIIKNFLNENKNNNWFSKTKFLKIINDKENTEKIVKIFKDFKDFINNYKNDIRSEPYERENLATEFTMIKLENNNIKIGRPEEALERYIVMTNDNEFNNQYPLSSGKENIDLVINNKNNNKITLIELKPWQFGRDPLYALLEIFKNFLRFKCIPGNSSDEKNYNLMILAPLDYYQNYQLYNDNKINDKATEIIINLLNTLKNIFNVSSIKYQYLNIDLKDFKTECIKVAKTKNEWKKKDSKRYPIYFTVKIPAGINDNLYINKWETLFSSSE